MIGSKNITIYLSILKDFFVSLPLPFSRVTRSPHPLTHLLPHSHIKPNLSLINPFSLYYCPQRLVLGQIVYCASILSLFCFFIHDLCLFLFGFCKFTKFISDQVKRNLMMQHPSVSWSTTLILKLLDGLPRNQHHHVKNVFNTLVYD